MAEILAWLTLLVGVPVSATAALLWRKKARKRRDLDILGERYITATVLTIGALFFGLIFVNNDQLVPPLDVDTTKIITRSVMLGMAVIPAVLLLRLYWKYGRPK